MDRETCLKLIMSIEHPEEVAQILSALDTPNRVHTFNKLHSDTAPKDIADELDVTRSAIQPYLTDFKEADLVEVSGKEYQFTEKGEKVYQLLEQLDRMFQDLTELQEFLIENPEIIPQEVLDEIERRRQNKGS
ncbi:winged helix-turn-helix domain-containing protein [Halobium salinum]|uniref:Winged helix-turn-helix domain-containing protein n=1 Tax=Halobium salinum TaxID=1364940 RepID=A0ABD5PF47_9EURY|nr:winged helix-turn-helix domain-containing protein [Halobium salinum]